MALRARKLSGAFEKRAPGERTERVRVAARDLDHLRIRRAERRPRFAEGLRFVV